jgi:NadR type nicotinamide-nucleotide adenylyltransferase
VDVLEALTHRVVLTGSESTGKTTLAEALARHYRVEWVPEYVRGYAERKSAPLTAHDVEPIARGQIALADAALADAEGLLLLDTDLFSTLVYGRHYYGEIPPWIAPAALARRADLYLLCGIDVPWSADPVRDRPHAREAMQQLFRDTLMGAGCQIVEITGAEGARLARARSAIDALRG